MMETKSNGKNQTSTLYSIICKILSFHYLFPTLTAIEVNTDECGMDKRRPLYPQGHQGSWFKYQVYRIHNLLFLCVIYLIFRQ